MFLVFEDATNNYLTDELSEKEMKKIIEEEGSIFDLESFTEYKLSWETEEYYWSPIDVR